MTKEQRIMIEIHGANYYVLQEANKKIKKKKWFILFRWFNRLYNSIKSLK